MDSNVNIIVTIVASVLASSGFWAFLQKRGEKKDKRTKMLIGLAHDRIISLGMYYIERGDGITQDEYENLDEYLYKPYAALGGNGTAAKVMDEVRKLPMHQGSNSFKGR